MLALKNLEAYHIAIKQKPDRQSLVFHPVPSIVLKNNYIYMLKTTKSSKRQA